MAHTVRMSSSVRRVLFGLLALFGSDLSGPISALAQREAGPAFVSTTVRLRSAPSTDATVRALIPTGERVEVQSCDSAWCRVQFRRLEGYVAGRFLIDSLPSGAISGGRGYINSQGVWVPSPARTPDDKPPAGATAKCRDGTYSFSQSRRGTCSHHGGVLL